MRISDWSSDVCSSDLGDLFHGWPEGCVDHWNLRRMDRHHAGKPVPSCPCSIGGQAFGIGDSGIDSLYGRNGRCMRAKERQRPYDFIRGRIAAILRSEEHTSELQSLMRNSYAVFCLKKKNKHITTTAK